MMWHEEISKVITGAATCKTKVGRVSALMEGLTGEPDLKKWFCEFLHHVLDPKWCYYYTLKGLPEPREGTCTTDLTPDIAGVCELLDILHERALPLAMANEAVADFLYFADPSLRMMFGWAIDGKLPGGIGRTQVNAACPGLIYKQPYPGVNPWDAGKASKMFASGKDVFWEPKEDGMAFMIDTGMREVRTRAGQDVGNQLSEHFKQVYLNYPSGQILFVEANLWDEGFNEIMPRPKSNGIFNSIFKSNRSIQTERIILTVLDMVPADIWYGPNKSKGPGMKDRHAHAFDLVCDYNSAKIANMLGWPEMNMVEIYHVHSVREARALTQREVACGREGGILKHGDAKHKNGKAGIKMKNEFECTLRVVDYKPHSKKPGWIGSLLCVSEQVGEQLDPRIMTYVGSGLNEEIGHELNRTLGYAPFDNVLVEVRAEKISKNNALDLPRLVEIRRDKSVADSYDNVQQAFDDSTSLGPDVY